MVKKLVVTAVAAALFSGAAMAESFNFQPIDGSAPAEFRTPAAPWKLPKGFIQKVVSDESDLNIYDDGRDDWHDMNTVNETGKKTGHYLYTTHEVRSGDEYGQLPNGAVSVVNLKTGATSILAQEPTFDAVDGIRWTPWGSIQFAEEYAGGRLFEIELNSDMVSGTVHDRPAVGRLAHEGIDVDAGGHGYKRPEDVEIIGNMLYVAVTEGVYVNDSQTFDGRVLAVNLDTMAVTNFVKPGVNVPVEIGRPGDADFQTGFDNPDNLAESPDGRLVIVEDNVPSDIWFARDFNKDGVADDVDHFASLSDYGAEGTGIYFNPEDQKTLYVNIQHSKELDGDGTWAITREPSEAR
jgi:hypothetical protein